MTATVRQALHDAIQLLQGHVDDPYTDSHVLLAHSLGKNRAWLIAHAEEELEQASLDAFDQLVNQRQQGMPVAYLLGQREFWSLPFKVTRHTLIPRPETEHLVERALALPVPEVARVLDYGTGSGVIAVVLAKERPGWTLSAIDCSPEALSVARENAAHHQVGITFLQACDLACVAGQSFDLIVSNPPYIRHGDPHLSQGDVRLEPAQALASGPEGLDCIRYLIANAAAYLRPDGYLLLEHGYDQAEAVRGLMQQQGFLDVETDRDFAGHERVTRGQWSAK
ncbi:MAG TPA: peptide chain release factor N(5)-glutamine methyltransferase [Gammaproteobacteria bacterium]